MVRAPPRSWDHVSAHPSYLADGSDADLPVGGSRPRVPLRTSRRRSPLTRRSSHADEWRCRAGYSQAGCARPEPPAPRPEAFRLSQAPSQFVTRTLAALVAFYQHRRRRVRSSTPGSPTLPARAWRRCVESIFQFGCATRVRPAPQSRRDLRLISLSMATRYDRLRWHAPRRHGWSAAGDLPVSRTGWGPRAGWAGRPGAVARRILRAFPPCPSATLCSPRRTRTVRPGAPEATCSPVLQGTS
jgi:hypothetical protein